MAVKKKNRQRNQILITASVMGVLCLGFALFVLMSLPETKEPTVEAVQQPAQLEPASTDPSTNTDPDIGSNSGSPAERESTEKSADQLVEDNGRTLWVSPTSGSPLSAKRLPPGCQLILWLRPADIFASSGGKESARVFQSILLQLANRIETTLNLRLREVQSLAIGVRPGDSVGTLDLTLVVNLQEASEIASGVNNFNPKIQLRRGQNYLEFPGQQFVIASRQTLTEVIELAGDEPPMSREMEQLLGASDSSRHFSMLVLPSFLFAEGKPIFSGAITALEAPLFEQLPDDLRGLLASTHFSDERLYWELRAAARPDLPAPRLSGQLTGQIENWQQQIQLALLELNPHPHGRRLLANLPSMTRVLARYTRRGVVERHAVLNGYLPPTAGQNLLMAAELMLAQQSGGVAGSTLSASTNTSREESVEERLAKVVTISFDRDTLEAALQILADEVQVPIVIAGRDLQLEGITKNQSFGLDLSSQPARQILVEILRRANPDKTASGPADPNQKLVYVVGSQQITVTTRAAAEKRGDKLPKVFEVE